MFVKFTFLLVIFLGSSALATDYCDPSLCQFYNGTQYVTKPHIACNNTGDFSPDCPDNAQVIPIDGTPLQDFVLSQHDVYRGILARGELEGFLPATKIPMMKWDSELASLALLNAKHCSFGHDECHNTEQFLWSGQNIALYPKLNSHFEPIVAINSSLNLFFIEYMDASQSNLDFYKNPPSGKMIGHFTLMVHQRAQYVGCALVQYVETYYNSYLVCNYSYTNVASVPVYTSGETCSQCQTECVDGLCSLDEVVILPPKP